MKRKPLRMRRILVAIGDLRRTPRSQLRKAATLARSMHASIELFHAINEPVVAHLAHRRADFGAVFALARDVVEQHVQRRLERLAQLPEFRGLRVRTAATWDY